MSVLVDLFLVLSLASAFHALAQSAATESSWPFERITQCSEPTSASELQTTKDHTTKATHESPFAQGTSDLTRGLGTESRPPQEPTPDFRAPSPAQVDVQPVAQLDVTHDRAGHHHEHVLDLDSVDLWIGQPSRCTSNTLHSPSIDRAGVSRLSPGSLETSTAGDNRHEIDVDRTRVDHADRVVELRGHPAAPTGVGVQMHSGTRGERGVTLAPVEKSEGGAA